MRSDAAPQDAGLVHGGLHGGTPAFRALRRHTRSLGAEVTGRSVPSPEHRHGHITASHAPAAAVRHLGKKLTVRRRRACVRAAPRAGAAPHPATARRLDATLALVLGSTHTASLCVLPTHTPAPAHTTIATATLSAIGERCAPRRVSSRGAASHAHARAAGSPARAPQVLPLAGSGAPGGSRAARMSARAKAAHGAARDALALERMCVRRETGGISGARGAEPEDADERECVCVCRVCLSTVHTNTAHNSHKTAQSRHSDSPLLLLCLARGLELHPRAQEGNVGLKHGAEGVALCGVPDDALHHAH